jgi:hypothetical protein
MQLYEIPEPKPADCVVMSERTARIVRQSVPEDVTQYQPMGGFTQIAGLPLYVFPSDQEATIEAHRLHREEGKTVVLVLETKDVCTSSPKLGCFTPSA